MSLIQTVVQMVCERGSATVDDLAKHAPGYSRAQVLQALQNAAKGGYLEGAQGKGLGPGKGKSAGVYRFLTFAPKHKGKPHSLTERCIEMVRHSKRATAEDLYERMKGEGITLKQINKALSNAVSNRRRLVTTRRPIPGTTTTQATYRMAPEDEDYLFTPNRHTPRGPSYPSVWHYAESFAPKYGCDLVIPTLATAWDDHRRAA